MTAAVTVYVSIGNSDDRLTQSQWAGFCADFTATVSRYATRLYGVWYSAPNSPFQNACIAGRFEEDAAAQLKAALAGIRAEYRQDSIAWAEAETTLFL